MCKPPHGGIPDPDCPIQLSSHFSDAPDAHLSNLHEFTLRCNPPRLPAPPMSRSSEGTAAVR